MQPPLPARNHPIAPSSLADYGTHYIAQISVGGTQHTVIQMSAMAYSGLKQKSVSLSASASGSYGLASGSVRCLLWLLGRWWCETAAAAGLAT